MGRKLNINNLSNEDEIIDKIINQVNTLNKKIKQFKNKKYYDHYEFTTKMIDGLVEYTSSGNVSKSKNYYKGKNVLWLKKTLSALHKINNHEIFGTVRKYEKEVTTQLKGVQDYTKQRLEDKGYDEKFINEIIYNKQFYTSLYSAFSTSKGYESDQVFDKVLLSYDTEKFNQKEYDKLINNMEGFRNSINRIKEEQDAFEEFKRLRNERKR